MSLQWFISRESSILLKHRKKIKQFQENNIKSLKFCLWQEFNNWALCNPLCSYSHSLIPVSLFPVLKESGRRGPLRTKPFFWAPYHHPWELSWNFPPLFSQLLLASRSDLSDQSQICSGLPTTDTWPILLNALFHHSLFFPASKDQQNDKSCHWTSHTTHSDTTAAQSFLIVWNQFQQRHQPSPMIVSHFHCISPRPCVHVSTLLNCSHRDSLTLNISGFLPTNRTIIQDFFPSPV